MVDQWMVIVSGAKMVEDLRKRPDDEVSFLEGTEAGLNSRYTIGGAWLDDPYHVDIIREKLTRTLPAILPDVLDELALAVPAYIPTHDDGEHIVDIVYLPRLIVPARLDHCEHIPYDAKDRRTSKQSRLRGRTSM